jgi:hypothetical protein
MDLFDPEYLNNKVKDNMITLRYLNSVFFGNINLYLIFKILKHKFNKTENNKNNAILISMVIHLMPINYTF